MDQASFIKLISGRRRGPLSAAARGLLRVPAALYAGVLRARNLYYDRLAMPVWLEAPVISVGNITVGGTGKTPMTIWLCERMLRRGRRPAVLSRGYKGTESGADEMLLVSRRVPEAVAIANPNRAAAGQLALENYNVRAIILDDGFQHRRVGRDLDLVLVDATLPFGYGRVLPCGLLREPLHGLHRAEAFIITRCNQARPRQLEEIERTLRRFNPNAPIVRAVHRPTGFVSLSGEPVSLPAGGRIGCFAGIARPEAFERTLREMKLAVTEIRCFPDHHAYAEPDVRQLQEWAVADRLDALVTTEKDAVKLFRFHVGWPVPVAVLRVDIEMLDDGDKMLDDLIDTMLKDHEDTDEPDAPAPPPAD